MPGTELLLFAFLVESFTEYAFGQFLAVKPYLKYIALLLGVVVAVAYKIDIIAGIAGLTSPIPWIGSVLSGLIIGRGSNYLNDLVSFIKR
jgi:hypothetical protein